MGLGSSVFIIFFGIIAFILFGIIWSIMSYVFNNIYNTMIVMFPVGVYNITVLITITTIILWFPVFVTFIIVFYWYKNAQGDIQ